MAKIARRRIIGSQDLMTSTAMEEIVPNPPVGWDVPITFKSLSFFNSKACRVILNGQTGLNGDDNIIYLRANQGLNIDETDIEVRSFIIMESDIPYNFVGKY